MSHLSITISLCFAFILLTLIGGTNGDYCYDYGYSCPRPGIDYQSETTCCRINGIPSCCDVSVLAAWAIGVVVTTCFLISFVVILVVCACCPCCWLANRRRRNRYVVVSNEAAIAYPQSTTRTTYVYNTSSYPAGQPNYGTGYPQATAPPVGAPAPNTYVKQ